MIQVVGPFITALDTTLTTAVNSVVTGVSSAVHGPAPVLFALYYLIEGVRIANGDPAPMVNFVPKLIRNFIILALATDLDTYNYYVSNLLCTALPNFLNAAVTSSGINPGDISSVTTAFDNIYAQLWVNIGLIWQSTGPLTFLAVALLGGLSALSALISLGVTALFFVIARFMMEIVVAIGPVMILCGMFDVTRPFLERWIGKIVSLILLSTIAFLITGLILAIDQQFMVRLTNNSITVAAGAGDLPAMMQDLVVIMGWFAVGTVAVVFLPRQIAYSIGTGVALSGPSTAALLMAMTRLGGGDQKGSPPAGGPSRPSYNLDVNRKALPATYAALPSPPAPPPLSHSTRR